MTSAAAERDIGRWGRYIALGVLAGAIVSALIIAHAHGWLDGRHLRSLAVELRRMGSGPIVMASFIALFVLAVLLALPATPLDVIGGALFGFWLGLLLNLTALLLAAASGYGLAMALAHRTIGRRLEHRPRWRKAMRSVRGRKGFWRMFRLQMIPLVPPALMNYAAGSARVGLKRYLASAALGHLVPTAIFTWFANRLFVGLSGAQTHAWRDVAIAIVLIIALTFVPRVFGSEDV